MSNFHTELGEKIKQVRISKGISREELAFRTGVSGTYIGMIERGEKDFKVSKLNKIALGLKCEIAELF